MGKKMKLALRIISIFLASLLVLGALSLTITFFVRGSINDEKYPVPTAFTHNLSSASTELASGADARVMSANLLVHYKSWGGTDAHMRANMFFDLLAAYQPDVVGLQEMSDQWFCLLASNKSEYKMIDQFTTGAMVRMTTLIYNSEKVDLIEKGQFQFTQGDNPRLRRVVWGVFEKKGTGKRFAVASTHFDLLRGNDLPHENMVMAVQTQEMAQLIKQLEADYDCPVFALGDFNSMDLGGAGADTTLVDTQSYQKLASEFTVAKEAAGVLKHGNSMDFSRATVDHIFVAGEAEVKYFRLLSDEVMMEMSDHFPIFADVSVK